MLRHVIFNEPRDSGNASRNWFTIWSKLDSTDLKEFLVRWISYFGTVNFGTPQHSRNHSNHSFNRLKIASKVVITFESRKITSRLLELSKANRFYISEQGPLGKVLGYFTQLTFDDSWNSAANGLQWFWWQHYCCVNVNNISHLHHLSTTAIIVDDFCESQIHKELITVIFDVNSWILSRLFQYHVELELICEWILKSFHIQIASTLFDGLVKLNIKWITLLVYRNLLLRKL